MGWFDDNHPAGDEAEANMNEVLEMLGMGAHKWQKDPQPPGGNPEPKRIEFPESEWDSTKWRKSTLKGQDAIAKGKAKTQFLLNDKELLPLSYRKETNSYGYNNMKMYRKHEVERIAWNKYGGPNGLKAAKAAKKNGVKFPTAAKSSSSSPRKSKSSTSEATGGKRAIVGRKV